MKLAYHGATHMKSDIATDITVSAEAGFDAIENINLLLMLSSPSSFPSFAPLVASICATIKFGLIIATILFWVIGLVYSAIKRILQE